MEGPLLEATSFATICTGRGTAYMLDYQVKIYITRGKGPGCGCVWGGGRGEGGGSRPLPSLF